MSRFPGKSFFPQHLCRPFIRVCREFHYGLFIIVMILNFINQEDPLMAQNPSVVLPAAQTQGHLTVEEAISQRRSQRQFKNIKLSLAQIGQLLWAAQGITGEEQGTPLRSAPSAGALYPMEIYAVTPEAVYLYVPEQHKLLLVEAENVIPALAEAALGQAAVEEAPLNIVVCAVQQRTVSKYGERGRQYIYYEAGHIAQNIHLQALGLGLGSLPIGAFDEQALRNILSLPADQRPLYIIPVGYVEE